MSFFMYFFTFIFHQFSSIICLKYNNILTPKNRNRKARCYSVTRHRQLVYNIATKSLKGAVVTTKPRRSRRGRGAAAIIEEKTIATQ